MKKKTGQRNNLMKCRVKRGLSQTELAKLMGVNHSCISSWETEHTKPSTQSIALLSSALKTPIEKIFPDYFKGSKGNDVQISIEEIVEAKENTCAIGLKELREKAKLSQYAVAKEIGTHQVNVSRWERGEGKIKSEFIKPLCELLSCTQEELLGISTNESEGLSNPDTVNELVSGVCEAGEPNKKGTWTQTARRMFIYLESCVEQFECTGKLHRYEDLILCSECGCGTFWDSSCKYPSHCPHCGVEMEAYYGDD